MHEELQVADGLRQLSLRLSPKRDRAISTLDNLISDIRQKEESAQRFRVNEDFHRG